MSRKCRSTSITQHKHERRGQYGLQPFSKKVIPWKPKIYLCTSKINKCTLFTTLLYN